MQDNGHARPDTLEVWHQRLGHLNKWDIERLQQMASGVEIGKPPVPNKIQCTGCLVGKDHRYISRVPRTPASRKLAIVFVDICGPMRVKGLFGDAGYFCIFVDGKMRFTWTYCIKTKDEVRIAWTEWSAVQENWTGLTIQILFSNNEPCLLKAEFQSMLAHRGIQHFTTQTYSSEMNSPAENVIKYIVQRASAMLHTTNIPEGFWPEAVRVSTYLQNHSPYKAIGMTPYEAWFGKKPNLSHIRIFGCWCYRHVEKKTRTKWDSHTTEGILIGYFAHEGLYVIYDVNKRVLVKKRDVTFFENVLRHPSMAGYGLAPGYDILRELIIITDDTPELIDADIVTAGNVDGVEQIIGDLQPLVPAGNVDGVEQIIRDLQPLVPAGNVDEVQQIIGDLQPLELVENVDGVEQIIGDLQPSAEEILALSIASVVAHNDELEDDSYVPVDTLCNSIPILFIHQALKEWQQEQRRPRHSPVEQDEKDRNELCFEQTISKYR